MNPTKCKGSRLVKGMYKYVKRCRALSSPQLKSLEILGQLWLNILVFFCHDVLSSNERLWPSDCL